MGANHRRDLKCSDLEARRCCCRGPVYTLKRRNTCEHGPESLCRNVHIRRSGSGIHESSAGLCGDKDPNFIYGSYEISWILARMSTHLCRSFVRENQLRTCRCRYPAAKCRWPRSCRATTGIGPPLQTGIFIKNFRKQSPSQVKAESLL